MVNFSKEPNADGIHYLRLDSHQDIVSSEKKEAFLPVMQQVLKMLQKREIQGNQVKKLHFLKEKCKKLQKKQAYWSQIPIIGFIYRKIYSQAIKTRIQLEICIERQMFSYGLIGAHSSIKDFQNYIELMSLDKSNITTQLQVLIPAILNSYDFARIIQELAINDPDIRSRVNEGLRNHFLNKLSSEFNNDSIKQLFVLNEAGIISSEECDRKLLEIFRKDYSDFRSFIDKLKYPVGPRFDYEIAPKILERVPAWLVNDLASTTEGSRIREILCRIQYIQANIPSSSKLSIALSPEQLRAMADIDVEHLSPEQCLDMLHELQSLAKHFSLALDLGRLNEKVAPLYENLVQNLTSLERHELGDFVENLSAAQLAVFLPRFLYENFLRRKVYLDIDWKSRYYYLIDGLRGNKHLRPDFLYSKEFMGNDSTHMLFAGNPILNPAGIQTILTHLKNKPGSVLRDITCHVCPYIDDLPHHLKQIDLNKDQRVEILLRHYYRDERREYGLGPHITPIHIQVRNGKMTVVVTDSVGGSAGYNGRILDIFDQVFTGTLANQVSVFCCTTKRQRDVTNCPVFSLKDTLEFAKHPELFEEVSMYASSASIETGKVRKAFFTRLPPYMMKVTQSLEEIKQYIEQGKMYIAEMEMRVEKLSGLERDKLQAQIEKLGKEIATLEKTVDKHTVGVGVRKHNQLINQRYQKYEILVAAEFLGQLAPRERLVL